MNIVCISGTRADYGIYRPLLLKMEKDPNITLSMIVTGMHLIHDYGYTIAEIEQDKLDIVETPSILFKGDHKAGMSQSLGMAVLYFANALERLKPDYILLLGDRGEMMAAAIAAHYQNITIVHLHGGERSGSADDAIRHCISQLAHVHLVSCEAAQRYLEQMGVDKHRICHAGSLRKTEIMALSKKKKTMQREFATHLPFELGGDHPFIVLAIHPDSKENTPFLYQVNSVLDAISYMETPSNKLNLFIIGANSDAGGERFNQTLLEYASKSPEQRVFLSSVRSELYLYILSQADVLIGNTSSGIIEAPFFQLPFVNIGQRQKNRQQGDNVIPASYDQQEIGAAINQALSMDKQTLTHNPYDVPGVPEKQMIRFLKDFSDVR